MDAVEDIKSRLSIEDVISRYVELKRAGRNFRGLSPFGSEKTPSFMVSPEKQIWHDFSSGKGGTMFSFIMELEGVDFKGALEILARQAGVDLTRYQTSQSGDHGRAKERFFTILELAAKFYQIQFSRNQTALEYVFKKRAFTKQTALDFRLGYAPTSDASLCAFLIKKGFTEKEIHGAGLGSNRYGSWRDMFRGRLMVPLADAQGRIIGFTARLLVDDPNAPKYINTPQTMLYDKSRHVFGLHQAKEAIRRGGFAVVVEGNLDVIASHQVGVKQVVATAGTAMTEMHLKALGRFADDIRLAFDQDGAGIAATERSIPLASRAGVSLSIIDIVGGKDPDELIRKDPAAWEHAIQSQQYAVDWLISQYQKRLNLETAVGKREFTDVILKVIRGIDDSVEQDHYVGRLAKLIDISPDALREKLRRGTPAPVTKPLKSLPKLPALDPHHVERVKAQNQLLAITFHRQETRVLLEPLTAEMLPDQDGQQILKFLQQHKGDPSKQGPKPPRGTSDYAKILVLLYEELYQDLDALELLYEAARLQVRLIDYYVKDKKAPLTAALRAGSDGDKHATELLEQVKVLDTLLKEAKENMNAR